MHQASTVGQALLFTPRSLVIEANGSVPCIGCHTDCCSKYAVLLTAHDIYRIATRLSASPLAFMDLLPATPAGDAVHLTDGYFRLALGKDDRENCIFLMEIGGKRRCSIQSFKPRVCIVYPFALDDAGALAQRSDLLCPRPWHLTALGQQIAEADVHQMLGERAFYEALVALWNDDHPHGGDVTTYVDFLLEAVRDAASRAQPVVTTAPGETGP
jgi:Fe-S-cluster containining protein